MQQHSPRINGFSPYSIKSKSNQKQGITYVNRQIPSYTDQLESQVRLLDDKVRFLEIQIQSLETELDAFKKLPKDFQYQQLKNTLSQKDAQIIDLQQELNNQYKQVIQQLDNYQKQIQNQSHIIITKTNELDQLSAINQHLQTTLLQESQVNKQLKEQLVSVSTENESYEQISILRKEEMNNLIISNLKQKQQVEEINLEISIIFKELKSKSQIDSPLKYLDKLSSLINGVQEDYQKSLSNLKEQIHTLNEQRSDIHLQNTSQLEQQQKYYEILLQERNQIQSQLRDVQLQCSQMQLQVAALDDKLLEQDKVFNDQLLELKNIIRAHEQRLTEPDEIIFQYYTSQQ